MKRFAILPPLLLLLFAEAAPLPASTPLSLPSIPNSRLPSAGKVDTVFPAATGGHAPYHYSVTGLPRGISFSASTRRARGTLPTVRSETAYTITYTVRDWNGGSASVTFTATVVPPPRRPPLSLPSIPNSRLPSAGVVDTVFPAATGGEAPYHYSVTGLPPGISFSGSTRRARGTLPTVRSETTYTITYTVRDWNRGSASVTFTATVVPPPRRPPLSLPSIPNSRVPSGGSVDTVFPAATGGTRPYSYSVSGLPAGISFSSSTRRARGTLPTVSVDTTYSITYTVRDSRSATDSVTFTAVVTAPRVAKGRLPRTPPTRADPPTTPVDVTHLLPFTVSETGVSGEKSYRFTLDSSTKVSLSLTGMNRNIDCRVNSSPCTNRSGTADDSWSGTLDAGTHTVTVFASGGGAGSWTLSVSGRVTSPPRTPPPAPDSGPSSHTYALRLSSSVEVSVELTGMTADFDCTVGGNPCTNRRGTLDDSWSGTLAAGDHEIVVYPHGGASGDYTLAISARTPDTGGSTGTRTKVTTLVDASGTNVSGNRTYTFTLARAAKVDVALTGMTIDFDCRVSNRRCTNNRGTADDSWSGSLEAGAYWVLVNPYDAGPGDYSLTVKSTETVAFVATPMAAIGRICNTDKDGNETCQTIYGDGTKVTAPDPGPPIGTGPGQGNPSPTPPPNPSPKPGPSGGGTPSHNRDSNSNSVMDSWREVVDSGKSCGYNFTEGERLGAPRGGGSRTHQGVDFGANRGDEVRALHDGAITFAGDSGTSCGESVEITNTELKLWTRYCHLDSIANNPTNTVSAGDPIGGAGRSGLGYDDGDDGDPPNMGVHAHIEHRQNDVNKPFYEATDTQATAANLVDTEDGGC